MSKSRDTYKLLLLALLLQELLLLVLLGHRCGFLGHLLLGLLQHSLDLHTCERGKILRLVGKLAKSGETERDRETDIDDNQ